MGTLKAEKLQGGTFLDVHGARTEVFPAIDAYDNTRCKYSSLVYHPPSHSPQVSPKIMNYFGPYNRCISFWEKLARQAN